MTANNSDQHPPQDDHDIHDIHDNHDEPIADCVDQPTSGEKPPVDNEASMFATAAIKRRVQNRLVNGALIVHYASRDVTLEVDGDVALRLIQKWQEGAVVGTRMDPDWASADRSWIGIDMAHVNGLSWHPRPHPPHGHEGSDRLSVDTLY